jgi:hypothetical protein
MSTLRVCSLKRKIRLHTSDFIKNKQKAPPLRRFLTMFVHNIAVPIDGRQTDYGDKEKI